MPGSGTAVPPEDDVVEPPDVPPPEVEPPEVPPPEVLPPVEEPPEVEPPDVDDVEWPPEDEDVEVPPHELDVDDEVDELDEDELEPWAPPWSPTQARDGVTTSSPARTAATVAMCFMEFPLQCWPQSGRMFRLVNP